MRIRYFSFVALGVCAVFLIVASQAFALVDIANLALGIGIGMLVLSAGLTVRYRRHISTSVCGICAAVVSAWMIIASQVFSLSSVQDLTFAEALAITGLALVGLTAHELSTERVVHSLSPLAARDPAEQPKTPREPALN
ncbi:MAG: hypothetical protein ACRDK2_08185 [Solirubrobacteraceae bacterium]